MTLIVNRDTPFARAHGISAERIRQIEAVEEAIHRYGKPAIFSPAQGSPFPAEAFTGLLKQHGIRISMDGQGAWRDNVFV